MYLDKVGRSKGDNCCVGSWAGVCITSRNALLRYLCDICNFAVFSSLKTHLVTLVSFPLLHGFLNGVAVVCSIIKIQHLLSYKNCAERTIATLESQALQLKTAVSKTDLKGLLEVCLGTKATTRLPDFKPSSEP